MTADGLRDLLRVIRDNAEKLHQQVSADEWATMCSAVMWV